MHICISRAVRLIDKFEVFCWAIKLFLGKGTQPPLYYIRTGNGLEVDLLIEPSAGVLLPVEIKLTLHQPLPLRGGASRNHPLPPA